MDLEARDVDGDEDGAEVARIREIRGAGLEREIWIARYGLNSRRIFHGRRSRPDRCARLVPGHAGGRRFARVPLALRGELTNARREDARGRASSSLTAWSTSSPLRPSTRVCPLC